MTLRIAVLVTLAWAASSRAAVLTLVPAVISRPSGVALDHNGNLYVADPCAPAIKKRDAMTGEVTTLVPLPDDSRPTGLAVDGSGNVFFADPYNNSVERWSLSTGKVTTIVSSNLVRLNAYPFCTRGSCFDGTAQLAVDTAGNVYIADTYNNAIKKWNAATQQVTGLTSQGLNLPYAGAVDTAPDISIAEGENQALKRWGASPGQVTTPIPSGLLLPYGLAVDLLGNVYIAEENMIEKWSAATQQVTPLDPPSLDVAVGIAVDDSGSLYFSATLN